MIYLDKEIIRSFETKDLDGKELEFISAEAE